MASSLCDFIKRNPPFHGGKKCWVCSIPEAKELDKAWLERTRSGITLRKMLDWLIEDRKYEQATHGRLESHFVRGRHHLRSAR